MRKLTGPLELRGIGVCGLTFLSRPTSAAAYLTICHYLLTLSEIHFSLKFPMLRRLHL